MGNLDQRYVEYYTPLVQDFIQEIDPLTHPDVRGMPQPHLPLFGSGYEGSALKLVVVGQDTLGWGDLRQFIADEKARPGCRVKGELDEFRKRDFTQWGPRRQTFWGFVMMTLAALHGQPDWGVMKRGGLVEILNSFAWAEGNAAELYTSVCKYLRGVPRGYWDKVRAAADGFDRFRHIVKTLRPDAALILYRGLDCDRYFDGLRREVVHQRGRLTHFYLPDTNTHVFHAPHPISMNRRREIEHFCQGIKKLFIDSGLTPNFPKFVAGPEEGRKVIDHLSEKSPPITADFDKYAFVVWVAEELTKRKAFMSVPTLANLVNEKGGRTNYGTVFDGERGSYRLVSGTYHRLERAGKNDAARRVAEAFRKPNFEYAYDAG
jgi:hypothetical protein